MTGRAMAARSDETGTGSAEGNSAVANGDGPQITGDNPMTDTTDQQAVTVAQEATEAMLDAGRFAYKDGVAGKRGISRQDVMTIWSAMLAASPEPVPATNQAGEVERLLGDVDWGMPIEAVRYDGQVVPATSHATRDDRAQWVTWRSEAGDVNAGYIDYYTGKSADHPDWQIRNARAALATQPATSQEGESANRRRLALEDATALEKIAEEADENGWLDWAAMARQAAERFRHALAATPTPPTLSEDLREALEAWRDAQQATDDAVEHMERAIAEGWYNEPGGTGHVGDSDRRADAAWAKAIALRDTVLIRTQEQEA
jgi:hypothetical protein